MPIRQGAPEPAISCKQVLLKFNKCRKGRPKKTEKAKKARSVATAGQSTLEENRREPAV
jgi:hypothetical protein